MNYYNPYFYSLPPVNTINKVGLFSRLFGNSKISLGGILNGTQRALNFANQAIPFVKQVKPLIGNTKTMFKLMNEFKRNEKNIDINIKKKSIDNNMEIKTEKTTKINNGPTFFI